MVCILDTCINYRAKPFYLVTAASKEIHEAFYAGHNWLNSEVFGSKTTLGILEHGKKRSDPYVKKE